MGVVTIKFGVLPLCNQTELPLPEPPVLSVPHTTPVPVLLRTCPFIPVPLPAVNAPVILRLVSLSSLEVGLNVKFVFVLT